MQRYPCPNCKSKLDIQRTFNKKIRISCPACNLTGLLEHADSLEEAVLDFASKFDKGKIGTNNEEKMIHEGIIRDEDEIRKMVGRQKIDSITKKALYSKKDYISHYTRIKNPSPKMGSSIKDIGLDEKICQHLKENDIEKLYQFQEEAIEEIMHGNNVIIEAPTASGKTEAFLIPIIQKIKSQNTRHIALFVYPTKSLARDQSTKIIQFAKNVGISAAVFDGDTERQERDKIIENPPQIIITNFDVIHWHLWHKTKLASLLSQVQVLVVDEVHVYSGIFGSNIYYVIKRLGRLAKKIQFIAASATLDNAKEFCEKLFCAKMIQVKGSGRSSETDFVMAFPSLRTQRALMVDLAKSLTAKKHKTMVFSNSHRNAELLAMQAQKLRINIKVHRAGLMANYRRSVEQAFKTGSLAAISCTPTLELGIDVGNVDGVISSKIPVNRLMQRIGRAARKGQHGYAFLALGNDPISQYYKNHPDDYFEDVEQTYIDPQNPFVQEHHVLAMAADKPISQHELAEYKETITQHIKDKKLISTGKRYTPSAKGYNALKEYSIRGIGESIDIFLNAKKVGERVLPIALEELHPDAIYFLGGTRYRVKEMQHPKIPRAMLERIPRDYPYYTKALTDEWPTIKQVYEKRQVFGMEVAFCKLHIQKTVHGYINIEIGQEVTQGERKELDKNLEYDFITKGIAFHAPRPEREILKAQDEEYVEASSYHATEHVIIEGSNMITGGASQDLGGISLGTTGMIFVYDGAIGGSGASKALYDRFEAAAERSKTIVKECPCKNESGCPRCTFSYRCGNNNEYLHKLAALEVFERMLDGEQTKLEEPVAGTRPLV